MGGNGVRVASAVGIGGRRSAGGRGTVFGGAPKGETGAVEEIDAAVAGGGGGKEVEGGAGDEEEEEGGEEEEEQADGRVLHGPSFRAGSALDRSGSLYFSSDDAVEWGFKEG